MSETVFEHCPKCFKQGDEHSMDCVLYWARSDEDEEPPEVDEP